MDKLETKKQTFIECLKANVGNVTKACEQMKISRQAYYNWLNDDYEFRENINNIDEFILDRVEQALLQQIENGNITGIIFYLKTKGKKRGYVEKLEFDTKEGYQVPIINLRINSSKVDFASSEDEVDDIKTKNYLLDN